MDIEIISEESAAGVAVTVRVRLSGRETNKLFLDGDTLIQLPFDGALPEEGTPIPRTSIFLSELAGLRGGFRRTFAAAGGAQAFADDVRSQLTTALEGS